MIDGVIPGPLRPDLRPTHRDRGISIGEPVLVDYVMHGEIWLISDIYLDSAISEVATRRSEFAAILRKDGIDGLIAALNRKADMLSATTAKAF